mgnify:CR=1 FL=1
MLNILLSSLLFFAAYLLGSFPTGYLAGKLLKGIDIREHGSGSTGATNVLRTLGKVPAALVLLIDLLKGAAAIALIPLVYSLNTITLPPQWQSLLTIAAGIGVLLGHSKSIWLNFTGGKSVATGLGILFALSWQVGLGALGVFLLFLAASRIVSLSSITAAIAAFVLMIFFQQPLPYQLFVLVGSTYVIWRHRSNIQRLIAGTEPQLGQKSSQETGNVESEGV